MSVVSGSVLSKLINGAAAVLGAALFSQFPAFYQQYLQRLGGGLDQARIAVQRIEEVARSLGLTVDNMVERFMMSRDAAYKSLGAINVQVLEDLQRLQEAEAVLANATGVDRIIQFFSHLDMTVAGGTLRTYVPALPLTLEALVYAAIGMLFGILVYSGIEYFMRSGRRKAE